MSMLTCCAACGTAFRVTSEQLLAQQGKVRCGACSTVFSALENLVHTQGDAEFADATRAGTAYGDVDDGSASSHAAGLNAASITSPESTTAALVLGSTRAAAEDATLPPAPLEAAAASAQTQSDAVPAFVTGADVIDAASGATSGATSDAISAEAIAETASETTAETSTTKVASTTATAPAPPRTRFAWWSAAGALAALCGLALQGAYFYRNEIAAHFPETKPALAALCQQLACTFAAPRDAQAITIESHDLQAEPANKNVLALIALLRNRAAYAQDAPHLELTLTDAQEGALARRVFAPREYAAAAQMAPNSELPVRIMLDASQIKAAGYRLYAFYP